MQMIKKSGKLIDAKQLKFNGEFGGMRIAVKQTDLDEDWRDIFLRGSPMSFAHD